MCAVIKQHPQLYFRPKGQARFCCPLIHWQNAADGQNDMWESSQEDTPDIMILSLPTPGRFKWVASIHTFCKAHGQNEQVLHRQALGRSFPQTILEEGGKQSSLRLASAVASRHQSAGWRAASFPLLLCHARLRLRCLRPWGW